MKFEGVVVLFKPEDKMLSNIDSYIKDLDKLYVVDNTPGEDISEKFKGNKKIQYVPLKDNKGIAYALNKGAKLAIKDGADWLLTMDQDSSFTPGALKEMKDFIKDYSKNDKIFSKIIGSKFEQLGIVSPFHVTTRTINEKPTGIDRPLMVMTSGNLVNLKAYKKVKGFKDWMFIDCVDFEFCLNLRKHNYEIIQLNYVKLNHELGDTQKRKILNKTVFADNHSAFRRYFITRNRHYLYDLYHDEFPLYCDLEIARTKKELLKIWLLEKNKIKKTKAIYKGYRDYKKGITGIGDK